jgi:hypothetical protein
MKWLLSLVLVLLFVLQSPGFAQDADGAADGHGTQISSGSQSITSGVNSVPDANNARPPADIDVSDAAQDTPARELTLQQYVTPQDQAVKAITEGVNGLKDLYDTASRWIYISDEDLNRTTDKWLTPHEFLVDSPHYPANPVQGKAVGDCEEKSNTLVSMLRASGIKPEEVRVVLGEVSFNDIRTGHAWVEVFYNGQWLPLDPSWGPYWNEITGKLVNRKAVPFDYYTGHAYPVVRVWIYYNDIYYLDARNGTGDFPDSWNSGPTA